MQHEPRGIQRIGVLALLWCIGVYMRAPILLAAPLGSRIRDELGFGQTGLGALTTTPVLMLGLGALPAALLIGRFGARATLCAALVLAALASMLRGLAPDLGLLLGLTAVMGLAIAAMQPALPALVGRWCPGFAALASTVYLNGMMLGEFIGAGLTLPLLLPALGDDWRLTLLVFSLPCLLLAPLVWRPTLHGAHQDRAGVRRLPDWRDRRVWMYGVAMGTTGATFFGLNAYMGPLLQSKGLGGWLDTTLFVFNATQIAGSFFMMVAARAVLRTRRLLFFTVGTQVIGLGMALLVDSPALLPIVITLSLASALQLISLVTLPALISTPEQAGKLAAGMFAVGYVLAFIIPLAAGMASDLLGTVDAALWVFLACNLLCLPLAWRTSTAV
ncbi:MFS transporter [Salinisphaera aquimarina]|uniref:CynX/NimT family MFS transporter n=1 Tax=Salinisphaera aquimarina TaxID=2094031 RepID=A0ABV7ENF9_9GAMM